MRRPSKPLLIAGIPIAGLALTSYHGSGRGGGASAWSPPPVSSTTAAASTRSSRSSSSVVLLHSSTDTNTDEIDLTSLNLTPELTMMTTAFSSIPDEKTRHKQLLYMASKLPSVDNMRETLMIGENKVPGCLSTVYVDCTLDKKKVDDGDVGDSGEGDVMVVNYHGDSDGLLTKGLLALLIRGLNGNTPQSIQKVDPNFIQVAKISQTLTPGRNNGFLNMLAVMKRKAMEKLEEYESGIVSDGSDGEGEEVVVNEKEENVQQQEEDDSIDNKNNDSIVTSFDEIEGKPMYNTIMSTLIPILKPTSISLIDNSPQHAGHAGSKGWAESGESHFALHIVAEVFDGLSLVKRHQLIYMLLGDTMEKIHALEIKAMSPDEV
jgi:sulfur transfer protein SufE/stress-induced morphogen